MVAEFGGSNIGVPARHAVDLLQKLKSVRASARCPGDEKAPSIGAQTLSLVLIAGWVGPSFDEAIQPSEIRHGIVLGADHARFERRDEWVLADLQENGGPGAFLANQRGSPLQQRFLRDAIQVARSLFHVRARFGNLLPGDFHQPVSMLRFNRYICCLRCHESLLPYLSSQGTDTNP